MKERATNICNQRGFSLIELIASLLITLIILGVAVAAFSSALSTRFRQAEVSDALTSSQAALNVMTREIGNAGYGLTTNGIVVGDCSTAGGAHDCSKYLRIRSNYINNDSTTNAWGEDVVYYWDQDSSSVVRYDVNNGFVSGVINRVSFVDFTYYDYSTDSAGNVILPPANGSTTPSANTARINIKLQVQLDSAVGQPNDNSATSNDRKVWFNSDVTLRNANFMRSSY